MKLFLQTVIIAFLIVMHINAQSANTVDGAFNPSLSVPIFSATIEVNMQVGTGSASVVQIDFTYNTDDISIPDIFVEGTDYILHGDFNSFIGNIFKLETNKIRVAISNFGAPVPLSITPTDIITFNFTVTNPAGDPELVWTNILIAPPIGSGLPYALGNWPPLQGIEGLLPVELSSFTGDIVNETNVALSWETQTEVNNYGFDIQRRTETDDPEDGWTTLGFVEGNGNSNSPKQYSFRDKNPWGGSKFFYRLKQIDTDGQYEYSDEVEIDLVPTKYELYQNYPNPFNPMTNIKFSLPEDAKVNIRIYNMLGELVDELVNRDYKAGYHKVEFNASNYASGVYIYRLVTKNFTNVKKMMLVK